MEPESTLGWREDLPCIRFLGQTHPDQPCSRPQRTENAVEPLMTCGPKLRIRHETNRGYRLNMSVQAFTACGLGDMHRRLVNWIPNSEQACWVAPDSQTRGQGRPFRVTLCFKTGKTFSCGNNVVTVIGFS